MVKKVLYCALSIAILLPLFTFSVFAENSNVYTDCFVNQNGVFIGPIPPVYYNRDYGTNIRFCDLIAGGNESGTSVEVSAMGDWSVDDAVFLNHDLHVSQVHFKVNQSTAVDTVTFSIDFTSYEAYSKIFDLSSLGYVQFWWKMALKGYSTSGGSPNPESVTVKLYGDSMGFYDPDGDGLSDVEPGLYEYIQLNRDLLPVGYDLPEGNRFAYTWGAAYGSTITSSSMRSKFINRIYITASFASPVSECYFFLSDINYRMYDSSGVYMDPSGGGSGSSGAPPLTEDDMSSADTEGDIQTSVNKGFEDTQTLINNRIDDLSTGINNGFNDLKNDNMGYQKPVNPEMDSGLDSGNSLLDTMDQALADFDQTLDDSFDTLDVWLGNYSVVINTFWDGLFFEITALVTAVIMFLVIRKVVGR